MSEICWFTPPKIVWSPYQYLDVRGAENLHIYLWILKDLCWTQDAHPWDVIGMISGSLAVIWACYILLHAIHDRNYHEMWLTSCLTCWLFANVLWMSGEFHDYNYPDQKPMYEQRTKESGKLLITAFSMSLVYFVVIKPLNLFKVNDELLNRYDATGLVCRIPYFKRWRDMSWNHLWQAPWVIFTFITISVALDFVFTSLYSRHSIVDHFHYIAIFLWVVGNMTWAMGEVFLYGGRYDTPYNLGHSYGEATITARYYSSWLLVFAYLPIFVLYCIWFRFCQCNCSRQNVFDKEVLLEQIEVNSTSTSTSSSSSSSSSTISNSNNSSSYNSSISDVEITVTNIMIARDEAL